ncbi:hypothetical protein EST38_g1012 [Candolleomyces aberdarensis]|uniref:Rho1 guanine nucleotide exchange factor 1 n=1 Tax=Candolleomyces aberdarensis TaxID=2316362 RepID=A0A4Q2DWG7_9AGAR|nr:hypothetical protein EST38_g1012 [Candolleomyces aberdarensis]
MSNHRSASPVDEDLQRLYNEVWAGFSDDNAANSAEKDLENIYEEYGSENTQATPSSAPAHPPPQPPGFQYSSFYNSAVQNHLPSAPAGLPASPKSPRRALPPTPASPAKSSFAMPEPEPYQDPNAPIRPNPYSFDYNLGQGSGSDLLKRATTANATQAQSRRHRPLPSTDSASYYSPVSPVDHKNKALPDPYASNAPHRPPGASAPAIPHLPTAEEKNGYQDQYYDAYELESPNVNGHSQPSLLPPRADGPQGGSKSVSRQASHETLNSSKYSHQNYSPSLPSAPPYDTYSADPQDVRYPTASLKPAASSYLRQDPLQDIKQQQQRQPDMLPLDNPYDNVPVGPPTASSTSSSAFQYPTTSPEAYGDVGFEKRQEDPASVYRRPTDVLRTMADFDRDQHQHAAHYQFQDEEEEFWDEEEEDPSRFINLSLLSHIAVQLRDKIPRATHVKGSIPYERAFTGKDIVSTIQSLIQRELAINHGVSTSDRRVAVQVARSLQSQLFFYEVEWGGHVLRDGVEEVYMFLGDQETGLPEELPTGVITMLSRCYSPSCGDGVSCYAFGCPRKGNFALEPIATAEEPEPAAKRESWKDNLDPSVLRSLPQSEIQRQSIIHNIIVREEQYIQDLDIVETMYIKPLRRSGSTIMAQNLVEDFIDDVFNNILDLRECNRRLLEVLYVRQREQGPVIQRIGDIFLEAATEFRLAYPAYTGHYPTAEKRLKEEIEHNSEFKLFLEQCSRDCAKVREDGPRLDLKHFLTRPSEHLQKYPSLLEAILHETAAESADASFLKEAITAIKSLQTIAQLRTFQSAMGTGPTGKWEWHDMVSVELRKSLPKKEAKRQSIIFELIKGEMAYVKDLENIEIMYIRPLRTRVPPIIGKERLERFIDEVYHNFDELLQHHKRLVQAFHEIQREQHPIIRSVTDPMMDAALNFREAYMEYIPNYPIAAYRIDDEMANNPAFREFVEQQTRHPDAHRLDMKSFINRPIPRLLRYELLLKGIMDETEPGHEDLTSIPNVIDVIKALGKESEPGVASAKTKVELWRYSSNLVFSKQGENVDMDLANPDRNLIHSGKLLRQPDGGLDWNWSELFVLLFDNYLVLTKIKGAKGDGESGVVKYFVNRQPIPLDLLTLVNFTDPPAQRNAGILGRIPRPDRPQLDAPGMNAPNVSPESDARSVFPLTLHHNGRMGGTYVLYTESAQSRSEWKEKLEHAVALRKVVQDSNKAFEVETLSADTFLMPLYANANQGPAWEQNNTFTGKVTCSVPFTTPDGRNLVAVGCQEGVWIGYRHDPKSMRRVLQLKAVTQCAMLETFGIFLVLADKSLFAYHIEALVPSTPAAAHNSLIPQKLNGTKDVHFFSVGTLHGRTLVAYMKKKGLDSIFRVLEPVGDKITERVKAPVGLGSRLGFRSTKSDWFRIYRDFFLPSESFDLVFLKARVAILCAKGFEIMDLNNFNSVTIPLRDQPKYAHIAKRCDACRPMGMFRSDENEFLLAYDEFGLYVDKHGDPVRNGVIIEWEGTAERVACHPPFVLLFDTRFIEIRYIETGRLAQIIPGNDIRCIWDGRGVSSKNPSNEQQEAKVHIVMTNTEGMGRSKAIAQCVSELVPTVPIYPPQPSPRHQQQYRQQEFDQQSYYQQQPDSGPQHQHQQYGHAVGDVPVAVGYGYDQGANGYGGYRQQQGHYASTSTSRTPYQTSPGYHTGDAGARPSTAGSWRS